MASSTTSTTRGGYVDYHHLIPLIPTETDADATQFLTTDFEKFDYVFAMDRSNLSDLQRLQRGNPDAKAKVMLFGEFSGKGKAEVVNDPYYGGRDGFEKAFEQCSRFAKNFLNEVVGKQ